MKTLTINKLALIITSFTLALFALTFSYNLSVSAAAVDDVCDGIGLASGGEGCATPEGGRDVSDIVATAVNILSIVVGVAAVIMIIIGGFKFVLSGGDSAATTSARNTVLYALVGIAIAALAQVLVRYVLNEVR